MIIFLPMLVFKSIINIRSIKDGLYMDENGTFVENENMNIFVEYVFNFQGAPTMKIIAANGKTLTVKKESLFWRNVKGKGGTKWLYIPVEENAGLISSDNGYCFKRFADEIKLEDCPASKEDWTDCFLFQVKIGIDPDNINKCKRTIEKAKDIDTDYECGKKPTKPTPPCSQSPYRSKRNNKRKKYRGYKDIDSDYYSDQSSYTESDSYYRDNYKKRGRNFLINTSSEDSTEKEKSKNKNQSLVSSEINELFVLKNLLSKFKNTLKTHENTSNDK